MPTQYCFHANINLLSNVAKNSAYRHLWIVSQQRKLYLYANNMVFFSLKKLKLYLRNFSKKTLSQWCSNVLARGPHLSCRNSSRATRTNSLNKNYLKDSLK